MLVLFIENEAYRLAECPFELDVQLDCEEGEVKVVFSQYNFVRKFFFYREDVARSVQRDQETFAEGTGDSMASVVKDFFAPRATDALAAPTPLSLALLTPNASLFMMFG